MANNLKTAQLAKAVSRLTGDPGVKVKEGRRYRIRITTADGHDHAVQVQVDTHPQDVRPYQLPQIGRSLALGASELREALASWGPDELRQHLEQFSKAELIPRRR